MRLREEAMTAAMDQMEQQQGQHQSLASKYEALTRRATSLEQIVATTDRELAVTSRFKLELDGCEERLVREVALRKVLHNKLVDIVGAIRVVCRVRSRVGVGGGGGLDRCHGP